MKLEQCAGCGGFLPTGAGTCPHCHGKRSALRAVAAVIGSGAIAFTLMACYGAAPCPEGGAACQKTTPSTDPSAMPTGAVEPPTAPTADGGK